MRTDAAAPRRPAPARPLPNPLPDPLLGPLLGPLPSPVSGPARSPTRVSRPDLVVTSGPGRDNQVRT